MYLYVSLLRKRAGVATNESTVSEVIWTNESAPLCLKSVQGPDVVQTGHTGWESTMQAEDWVLHHRRQGEEVEQVGEESPDLGTAVLPQTLVIEPVHLGDLSALVVSSDQINPVWVANLQGQQQQEGFHTVESAVHEISHEEIVRVGNIAAHLAGV